MKLSDKIKELRISKNLTQEQLSKKSGISRVAIGNYERGDRTPNVDILSKLANGLDVDIDVFLDNDTVYTSEDLYKLINSLPNKDLPKNLGLTPIEKISLLAGTSNSLDHHVLVANLLGLSSKSLYNWILYNTICNAFNLNDDEFSVIDFNKKDMKLLTVEGILIKEPLDKLLNEGLCDENINILKTYFKDKEKRKLNEIIYKKLGNFDSKNLPKLSLISQVFSYYGYKVEFDENKALISSKLNDEVFHVNLDDFLDFSTKVLWSMQSYIDNLKNSYKK